MTSNRWSAGQSPPPPPGREGGDSPADRRSPIPDRSRSLIRAGLCGAVFGALFLALLARLYAVQILGVDARAEQRLRQGTGTYTLQGPPGHIVDRAGQVLALSVPVESVAVNPSLFPDATLPEAARRLARALDLPETQVRERLARHDRKFVFLKRKVEAAEATALRALLDDPLFRPDPKEGPRLIFRGEFARRYPHGSRLGNVVGIQSEDPSAHEGLERMLAQQLAGREAVVVAPKDGRGRTLGPSAVDLSAPRAELTIDLLFQTVVEEELDAACAQFRPKWAVAVALDPRTGEVLAVANRPAFDPSHPAQAAAGARLNRAVALPYEPGSTLKPFSAAWALELGLARPETKYDCENGLWKHGARVLHDHDPYGKLTLAEVVIKSSNIGAAKIGALTLGRERMHEALVRFGFGSRTGIDLPAEDEGRLFPLPRWNSFSDTSVPMGHEIMVTPLQLTAALAAIANGGTLYRPYAVRRIATADGVLLADNGPTVVRRVLSEKTCREMIEILTRTVSEGTGKKAQVPGVAVAGKTGTSQKIDPVTKRYTHEKYVSSFVGFAPAEKARICIAVVIDEPQGAYYGGTVAAPVVGRILQRGLVLVE